MNHMHVKVKTDNKENFELQISNEHVNNCPSEGKTEQNELESEGVLNSSVQEIFSDPSTFEFLLNAGNSTPHRDLRKISLYLKFDPYVGSPKDASSSTDFVPLQTLEEQEILSISERIGEGNLSNISNDAIHKIVSNDRKDLQPKNVDDSDSAVMIHVSTPCKNVASSSFSQNSSNCPSPIDRVETMKKELILLKRLLLQQDHSYSADLKRYEKLVSTMKRSLLHSRERDMLLSQQMPQNRADNHQFQVLIEEYENAITNFVAEKETARLGVKEKKENLEKQLQFVKEHLVNTKKAYSDLQLKYDGNKKLMQIELEDIRMFNIRLIEYQYSIKEIFENYEILKHNAESELNSANEELIYVERNHQTELSRLTALMRKSELRIKTLQETLEQKTKENRVLLTMCDELINNEEKKYNGNIQFS